MLGLEKGNDCSEPAHMARTRPLKGEEINRYITETGHPSRNCKSKYSRKTIFGMPLTEPITAFRGVGFAGGILP